MKSRQGFLTSPERTQRLSLTAELQIWIGVHSHKRWFEFERSIKSERGLLSGSERTQQYSSVPEYTGSSTPVFSQLHQAGDPGWGGWCCFTSSSSSTSSASSISSSSMISSSSSSWSFTPPFGYDLADDGDAEGLHKNCICFLVSFFFSVLLLWIRFWMDVKYIWVPK